LQALVVVDAQNEFAPGGQRTVPDHAAALQVIRARIAEARGEGRPIALVRHHNTGDDANAFVPGSWGAEFSPGIGPVDGVANEAEFVKEVVGAFSTTHLEAWLRARGCDSVLLVGFFAHMCVSTSAREAYVRYLNVAVDPDGTASRPIQHALLGEQTAEEVRRTALLHLSSLGVAITPLAERLSTAELPAKAELTEQEQPTGRRDLDLPR
jgi:nicotinamidase-related amidase